MFVLENKQKKKGDVGGESQLILMYMFTRGKSCLTNIISIYGKISQLS